MNQPTTTNGSPDTLGRSSNTSVRAPGAPPHGSESAAPKTTEPSKSPVLGSQDSRPLPAERVSTATQRPTESISAERSALPANAVPFNEAREAWVESIRCTIRNNPLGCVAAALALGAVITRITR